ncbi:MAG: NAD(P)-dependent oxidoreductase [Stellaceae bacterium]
MIGLVGFGKMGAAIAARLGASDAQVIAWDRDPARLRACAASGSEAASGPKAVAAASDTVLSIVAEDGGARWLWEGSDGFLKADLSGKLFIEMSTLQPMTVRSLAALAAGCGAAFVDSPVLGSIPTVRQGKLVALMGGSDVDVARARTVLAPLTQRVEHLGAVGAGAAMKLVINNMMGSHLQVLAESLMLGEAQGLPLARMLEVIGSSIVATPWFLAKKSVLAGGADETTLDIRTLRKDIISAAATAALHGVPVPAASATAASLSAAVAAGEGGNDIAALVAFLRRAMPQRW